MLIAVSCASQPSCRAASYARQPISRSPPDLIGSGKARSIPVSHQSDGGRRAISSASQRLGRRAVSCRGACRPHAWLRAKTLARSGLHAGASRVCEASACPSLQLGSGHASTRSSNAGCEYTRRPNGTCESEVVPRHRIDGAGIRIDHAPRTSQQPHPRTGCL